MGRKKMQFEAWELGSLARQALWQNFSPLLKIMFIPSCILTVLLFGFLELQVTFLQNQSSLLFALLPVLLSQLIILGVGAIVAHAVFRFVLANDFPPGPLWMSFGWREFRYMLEVMVIYVIFESPSLLRFALIAVSIFGFGYIDTPNALEDHWPYEGLNVVFIANFLLMPLSLATFWGLLRSMPLFAISSLDLSLGLLPRLKRAWKLSKGNAFRILFAIFFAIAPVAVVYVFITVLVGFVVTTLPGFQGNNIALSLMAIGGSIGSIICIVLWALVVSLYYQRAQEVAEAAE